MLEAARNVACAGPTPKALVNCLNFGNPEHPEVMWQFAEVVEGMSEACEALGIPVVGGNVSFYNESRGADIDPTPVVGVVGLIDRLDAPPPVPRTVEHEHLVVLGATRPELGGSEWAAVVHGLDGGLPPDADLDAAKRLHTFVRDLVSERTVGGVHDCSDGGIAVALAEMAFAERHRVHRCTRVGRAARRVVLLRVDEPGGRVGRRPAAAARVAPCRRCGRARRRPRRSRVATD